MEPGEISVVKDTLNTGAPCGWYTVDNPLYMVKSLKLDILHQYTQSCHLMNIIGDQPTE
jgi:hypothetical protein